MLSRAKKLPEFKRWMNPPKPARNLHGKEAERRKQEFEEDSSRINRRIEEAAARRAKEAEDGCDNDSR